MDVLGAIRNAVAVDIDEYKERLLYRVGRARKAVKHARTRCSFCGVVKRKLPSEQVSVGQVMLPQGWPATKQSPRVALHAVHRVGLPPFDQDQIFVQTTACWGIRLC
jgi:hypothetical protein